MVSDLFMKDYRAMTSAGVVFTPEDVIRLNALAVRVKLTQHPISAVNLPRACLMGDLVLREPTIGHEMWVERVSTYIDMTANRNFKIVYAYALSRDWTELPDVVKAKAVVEKVFAFARRNLFKYTDAQLGDAIDYVLFGADWKIGEMAPAKDGKESDEVNRSTALGVWMNAAAKRIPISLEDAKKMTASEILEVVVRSEVMDRRYDFDAERQRALAEYVRAREEIRSRTR